jgi:hypothetical protein
MRNCLVSIFIPNNYNYFQDNANFLLQPRTQIITLSA